MRKLESQIERECDRLVRSRGGVTIKLTYLTGIPDRLILLPGARVFFVEFKRPNKNARPIQEHWAKRLRIMGFRVATIRSVEEFRGLIR